MAVNRRQFLSVVAASALVVTATPSQSDATQAAHTLDDAARERREMDEFCEHYSRKNGVKARFVIHRKVPERTKEGWRVVKIGVASVIKYGPNDVSFLMVPRGQALPRTTRIGSLWSKLWR